VNIDVLLGDELAQLLGIADPIERAKGTQAFIERNGRLIAEISQLRAEVVVGLADTMTQAEIAQGIGLTRARVCQILKTAKVSPVSNHEFVACVAKTRAEPAAFTALYSYYDADDLPLYIGITGDLNGRERNHIKKSTWMEFVARSTVARYPTREEAEAAERAAIKAAAPLFNSKHNDTPEARRRLVDYLVKHNRTDLLAPAVSRG
jgi:hypothetical protein